MTIEDPIEYLHRDKLSLVNQREVGFDALSFASALRSSLRQDPDVILVGEMRDFETISTALVAAETGHLVLSTLHTADAAETINRVISVFPPHQQQQIRLQLATVLQGIVSMRLSRAPTAPAASPAVEVLVATTIVRECIMAPERTKEIPDIIAAGTSQYGMQTFDQALMELYHRELITYEEALHQATNPDDFALRVRGIQSTEDMAEETLGLKKSSGGAAGAPRRRAAAAGREGRRLRPASPFKIDRFDRARSDAGARRPASAFAAALALLTGRALTTGELAERLRAPGLRRRGDRRGRASARPGTATSTTAARRPPGPRAAARAARLRAAAGARRGSRGGCSRARSIEEAAAAVFAAGGEAQLARRGARALGARAAARGDDRRPPPRRLRAPAPARLLAGRRARRPFQPTPKKSS